MKERWEKTIMAIPPGFNTRCISAKTSRGFVKYCTSPQSDNAARGPTHSYCILLHLKHISISISLSLSLYIYIYTISSNIYCMCVWYVYMYILQTNSNVRSPRSVYLCRHVALSARVATSKVLSAHGNFCCSFKSSHCSLCPMCPIKKEGQKCSKYPAEKIQWDKYS